MPLTETIPARKGSRLSLIMIEKEQFTILAVTRVYSDIVSLINSPSSVLIAHFSLYHGRPCYLRWGHGKITRFLCILNNIGFYSEVRGAIWNGWLMPCTRPACAVNSSHVCLVRSQLIKCSKVFNFFDIYTGPLVIWNTHRKPSNGIAIDHLCFHRLGWIYCCAWFRLFVHHP